MLASSLLRSSVPSAWEHHRRINFQLESRRYRVVRGSEEEERQIKLCHLQNGEGTVGPMALPLSLSFSDSTPLANMSEIEHPMMVDYLQSSEIDARAPLRTFVPFPLIQIAEINMP